MKKLPYGGGVATLIVFGILFFLVAFLCAGSTGSLAQMLDVTMLSIAGGSCLVLAGLLVVAQWVAKVLQHMQNK